MPRGKPPRVAGFEHDPVEEPEGVVPLEPIPIEPLPPSAPQPIKPPPAGAPIAEGVAEIPTSAIVTIRGVKVHQLRMAAHDDPHRRDYTGIPWSQVPPSVRMAHEKGSGVDLIVGTAECVNCGYQRWAANLKLDDLCEDCECRLRAEVRDTKAVLDRKLWRGERHFNPFDDYTPPQPNFWPTK